MADTREEESDYCADDICNDILPESMVARIFFGLGIVCGAILLGPFMLLKYIFDKIGDSINSYFAWLHARM